MLYPKNWTAWYDRIMNKIKRVFSSQFKAKVALDVIKETDSISRVCSQHGIHPTQAGKWKSLVLAGLPGIFDNVPNQQLQEKDTLIENLYQQIGRLKVELDWLKKKTNSA